MSSSAPSPLARIAQRLPFAVDDYDAARAAFARWERSQTKAHEDVLRVWCYGYVLWYFYSQFARERTSGASDLDAAVGRALERVYRSFPSVRDPDRFPNYVSKICRNVLLSHRTRRRETVELTDWAVAVMPDEAEGHDMVLVRRLITRSIAALPPAIRCVARMRILEGQPYEAIAEATDRPIDSVRTYASKAAARLRQDPTLRDLLSDDA